MNRELTLEEQLVASTAIANFRKGQTMAEKIQFETNVPVALALKYAEGKRVDSNYNEYEMYFSTVDGRCFYAAPMLAEKIAALNLSAREEFTICKKEIRVAGSKPKIEWQVSRPEQSSVSPTAPAATQNCNIPNGPTRLQNTPPVKLPIDRAMTMFLLAAGRSTRTAEQVLGAEGGSVRFDSRDVAAIATSMFIHAGREGWLTAIAPEQAQSSIAEQKISELQPKPAAQAAASERQIPGPWTTRGEMRQVFAQLRELVGDVKYFEVLAAAKVADASQFRYLNDALACYNRLVAIVKEEAA